MCVVRSRLTDIRPNWVWPSTTLAFRIPFQLGYNLEIYSGLARFYFGLAEASPVFADAVVNLCRCSWRFDPTGAFLAVGIVASVAWIFLFLGSRRRSVGLR